MAKNLEIDLVAPPICEKLELIWSAFKSTAVFFTFDIEESGQVCSKAKRRSINQLVIARLLVSLSKLMKVFQKQFLKYNFSSCFEWISITDPAVLRNWCEVVKPGGKVVYSVKTSLLLGWEEEAEKLEKVEKVWKLLWAHPGLPYLPNLRPDGSNACRELVKLYIYQK